MEETTKNELYEKALKAQSAEEIAAIAAGSGIELAEGEADALFERLHGEAAEEIADEELENVAGGGCKLTRTVRPGVDKCGHAFCICYASCRYYHPHDDDPNVGECYNCNY